jgi:predicted Ser/Thr protein kinase
MSTDVLVHRLEEIFHQAILLGKQDRHRFLEHACDGQPELRATLERMLEADASTDSFTGICNPGTVSVARPGQSIGRWRLKRRIGSGGIGEVYQASCEADGVTLEAAVKILRPGFDEVLHEQFTQERLILARLDHHCIARLIDAGAGPCGTSFMAMEFVEGHNLDQWLEQRTPELRERLRLFKGICDAVHYLHEHGVVHGDLKPSNVIVTHEGVPKLVDFGIARFVARPGSHTSITRWMMTPAYASPEQLAGLGPSPQGDVYSLGCLLEEMLDGEPVCSDLRAIQNKCLARVANQRYTSPGEVAEDITRYLNGLPLRARPATPLYVARKFLRRNRTACGLAGLFVLSVVLGWEVSRQSLLRARQYAEQRRTLVTSLVGEDGKQSFPGARQRLAYAAAVNDSIDQMERMQPPPFADLVNAWRRLSYSQASRGQTPESIRSIQRAIWWARRYVHGSNTDDARVHLARSLLYAAAFHERRGDMRQAGAHALEAIQLADTLPESSRAVLEKTPEFVRSMRSAARVRILSGDREEARTLLVRAVGLTRTFGKSVQLRSILDLVRFERAQKQERANAWCAEAILLGLRTERLHNLCGTAAAPQSEDALTRLAALHENRLIADPEKYGDRLQLARLELRLGYIAARKGDSLRALERLERAEQLASELLKADPENRRLQRLFRNIRRSVTEIRDPQRLSIVASQPASRRGDLLQRREHARARRNGRF